MTAPDTNIEKQQRRHYPALLGMGFVVLAVVGFIFFMAPVAPDDDATNATVPTAASE
ncbi:MAG: hypothetical protein AAFU63_10585 [Pseudomonadota bacterium]